MEPFALKIDFTDGSSETVQAIAADLIAFESRFDLSVAKLGDEVRLTHLFFLAWHSLKRQGKTKDDFEKWIESVVAVSNADPKG